MARQDDDEAKRLLDTGWRQGSVFEANGSIGEAHGFAAGQRLVVLTQSCTVVSPRWEVAPHVEVAATAPVERFNERSPEARGKNIQKLHVPVAAEGHEALEIDLNSRQLVDRRLLLGFAPDGVQPDPVEARRIGGWMGRGYARIALPNALVDCLRQGWTKALETTLRTKFDGGKLDERILGIYIKWRPDDEAGPYEVDLIVLGKDQEATELADRILYQNVPAPTARFTVRHEVSSADATVVSDLDGWVRFTDYDYLSDLAEEDARI